jgi:glycerol kinase
MTAHANRNHVIRAALESIGYQLRDVLEAMRERAGVDLRTINADGGATRNRFLMQFIADITGLEITVAQMPDCSPLGAAMAGALGSGVYKSFDELAKLPRETETYRPTMPRDVADQLHRGWQRAVRQVLSGTEE